MRPERAAQRVLASTRAKAKMYEFDVPEEDHIDLPQSPDLLFSLAVGLLGDAAAQIADMSPAVKRESVSADVLLFSARYFDAYLQARLGEFAHSEFPILASACFYLADNPGSSKVLVNQSEAPSVSLGSGLALLAYRLLRNDYGELEDTAYGDAPNTILRLLSAFLDGRGTADEVVSYASGIRSEAYDSGDGRELLYADITAAIIRKKIAAAAATVLPDASDLPLETWRPFLSRSGFPRELWPSQQRICEAGVLNGNSALIQMPTSAGKTRATELILRSGFLAGRFSLAVMVCPFRSLCHDIRSDMARAFAGDNVAINEATDSFQDDLAIEVLWARRTILIVTPEKLLYLLRRDPHLADNIGLVIYDEGHQFDSGARGVTYELLLTSLKLLLAPNTQIILISAVIANAERISAWLLGDPDMVVDGTGLLPTARSIAFTSWRSPLGRLEYVNPLDPDDPEFFVPRVIEQIVLPRLPREKKDRVFPLSEDGPSVGLYLALKLVANGSVAVFCGRKDTAAGICDEAAKLFARVQAFDPPALVSNANEVEKISALFAIQFGADAPATLSSALGIFPHHASVPQGLRLSIEHAMKASLIRFVVCTSSLAQGVNLPIKYLIVTGVNQGKDRILVRDFHNLIGRAGRAGMHSEGSVIFADNAIFDRRRHRRERWKWTSAKELLDATNSEPSASSISSMFEPFVYGRQPGQTLELDVDQLHTLLFADDEQSIDQIGAAAHQQDQNVSPREFKKFLHEKAKIIHGIATFLLAHTEFGGAGLADRAVELAKNTLAHFLADDDHRAQIERVFRQVAETLVDGAATEDLRAAIRRSPLAPRAVKALRNWLEVNSEALAQAVESNTLFDLIVPIMLRHNTHGAITSLSDQDVIPQIVADWVGGSAFSVVLGRLNATDVRITGQRRKPKIEDAVSICEGGLGYEGAMIVASIVDLFDAEHDDDDVLDALKFLQRQLKTGLSARAAIAMYEVGFTDRVVAMRLGEAAPAVANVNAARGWIRENAQVAREIVSSFPAYFGAVVAEIAG